MQWLKKASRFKRALHAVNTWRAYRMRRKYTLAARAAAAARYEALAPRVQLWYRDAYGIMLKVDRVKVSDWHMNRREWMDKIKEVAWAWNHRAGALQP